MLGLVGDALAAATELREAFPGAVLVSGKRTIEEQAEAMAENIVADRNYVKQTHLPSNASRVCQLWVDSHPSITDLEGVRKGMLLVLRLMNDADLSSLSRHLTGDAFDVRPVGGIVGDRIKAFLVALAAKYGGRFLDREGSLVRWHWQAGRHK